LGGIFWGVCKGVSMGSRSLFSPAEVPFRRGIAKTSSKNPRLHSTLFLIALQSFAPRSVSFFTSLFLRTTVPGRSTFCRGRCPNNVLYFADFGTSSPRCVFPLGRKMASLDGGDSRHERLIGTLFFRKLLPLHVPRFFLFFLSSVLFPLPTLL